MRGLRHPPRHAADTRRMGRTRARTGVPSRAGFLVPAGTGPLMRGLGDLLRMALPRWGALRHARVTPGHQATGRLGLVLTAIIVVGGAMRLVSAGSVPLIFDEYQW